VLAAQLLQEACTQPAAGPHQQQQEGPWEFAGLQLLHLARRHLLRSGDELHAFKPLLLFAASPTVPLLLLHCLFQPQDLNWAG
jgi:hypothetical protein